MSDYKEVLDVLELFDIEQQHKNTIRSALHQCQSMEKVREALEKWEEIENSGGKGYANIQHWADVSDEAAQNVCNTLLSGKDL